ncbi:hypothetical protein BLA29_002333 [Euroglyphus maynei]|uniref:HTH CENPB-type domain-containing protein n=1 Tax=Euroglyphus maynei TaxID=6958 RepID=A0A1Y3BBN6_EURMA|nr:hypothetical protein BLA29_002333 [Euroglyphus maynei]
MGKIRRSFTADKKRQVIEYAEKYGIRAAEKQFNIAESNIRFWRKNKAIIEAMPETLRSLRYSRARHPQLEEELKTIIAAEQQKQSNRMRICDIRRMALNLARNKFGLTAQQFCARPSWVFSFCRRHGIKIGNKIQSPENKEARKLWALYRENRDHTYYKLKFGNKLAKEEIMTDNNDDDHHALVVHHKYNIFHPIPDHVYIDNRKFF